MQTDKINVLITDIHLRKAFDVVSIVRLYNYNIIFASDKDYVIQLPLIYTTKVHRLRKDLLFFGQDLLCLERKYKDMVYLPVEEDTTILFYEYLKKYPKTTIKYLLPNESSFSLARNKNLLQHFCIKNNYPIPTIVQKEDLVDFKNNFYALIAKPSVGSGSLGIYHIDTPEDLIKLEQINNLDTYLIQEKIGSSNEIFGAFFLFNDEGNMIRYYGHKRIRTYPMTGGVTVLSISNHVEELKLLGETLLKQLNWKGFAMIEFIKDYQSNNYKIIEINPRLWGSVLLSEFCNASFMSSYIDTCAEQPILQKQELENSKYIRWFFPFDIINYLKNKNPIKHFWQFDLKNTCYINFTYASWYASIMFLFYSIINFTKVKKMIAKIING